MGCGCVCCGNTQLDQSLVQLVCTVYTVWLQLHTVLHRCTTARLRGIVNKTIYNHNCPILNLVLTGVIYIQCQHNVLNGMCLPLPSQNALKAHSRKGTAMMDVRLVLSTVLLMLLALPAASV